MLSKHLILNELNKPAPPRSEDYGVDWWRVKLTLMELMIFNTAIDSVSNTIKEHSINETEFCLLYKGNEFFLFTENENIYQLFKLNHNAIKAEFEDGYVERLKIVSFEYSIVGNPGFLPF